MQVVDLAGHMFRHHPGDDYRRESSDMSEQARAQDGGDDVAESELVEDEPGTAIELSPQAVISKFLGSSVVTVDSPEQVQERMLAQRLQATTVEELMRGRRVRSAVDCQFAPLEVRDVHFMESRFDSGLGVYAAADVANTSDGEVFTLVTGSPDIVIQMAKLKDFGAFPAVVIVMASNVPEPGRNPALHLELAPKPLDQG
jgi:hypothetical protein